MGTLHYTLRDQMGEQQQDTHQSRRGTHHARGAAGLLLLFPPEAHLAQIHSESMHTWQQAAEVGSSAMSIPQPAGITSCTAQQRAKAANDPKSPRRLQPCSREGQFPVAFDIRCSDQTISKVSFCTKEETQHQQERRAAGQQQEEPGGRLGRKGREGCSNKPHQDTRKLRRPT